MKKYLAVFISFIVIACNNSDSADTSSAKNENEGNTAISAPIALNYSIQEIYPHDTSAYTQGLVWDNNKLFEGTGLRGESVLYQMDNQLKPVGKRIKLDQPYFGEGITVFKGKIYQLTWEEHVVFVYDATSFKKLNTLNWPYEGWGLTHNDTSLIVSTGGSNLYFVDPTNFSIQRTLGVFNEYGYQSMLNELEYVDGKIFANIYGQNDIVVIDPNSGKITNKIDCNNLLVQAKAKYNPLAIDAGFVLNGIAYRKSTDTYFLTGKCWPILVEVKLN
jgi:glutamine cyclotransferase